MATGVLLRLLGVFLLQPDRCDVVNDVLEPSEPLRLAQLYREGKRDEALRLFEAVPEGAVDRMIERVIEVRELSLKILAEMKTRYVLTYTSPGTPARAGTAWK